MKPLMTIPGPGQRRQQSRPVRSFFLVVLGLVAVYVGVFAVGAIGYDYPLVRTTDAPSALRGAWHVHTNQSDGRGTAEEIASIARGAGLHFVVITDHNPETVEPPRFHDGVLLVFGQELSTPNGHVVALGTSRALTKEERSGDVMKTVADLGGFAFLAHPVQRKNPFRDWPSAPRATGMEIYSADSMLRSAQAEPVQLLVPAAAAWLTNSTHGLLMLADHQPEAHERLLELASNGPYAAVCAHDAHGLPSYESVFRTLGTYLPPGPEGLGMPADANAAADRIVSAIASGESWCAFHAIAAGDGFAIKGIGSERTAVEGEFLTVELPKATALELDVRVQGPATLLDDGRRLKLDGPGAVQVEVWAKVPGMMLQDGWKPWLVPSPIRVQPKSGDAEAPPPPALHEPLAADP